MTIDGENSRSHSILKFIFFIHTILHSSISNFNNKRQSTPTTNNMPFTFNISSPPIGSSKRSSLIHPSCFNTYRRLNRARIHRLWKATVAAGGRGPVNNDDDDNIVDIDALAARLAAEAARLQSELGGRNTLFDDLASPPPPPQAPPPDDLISIFGLESKANEADILASVGDGGFSASEFELLQELGQISIQQLSDQDQDQTTTSTSSYDSSDTAPNSLSSNQQKTARAAVIAYTASYFSGMPFQDPVMTLMKEYLPGAKPVACNELLILKHLCGMPDVASKWSVAASPLRQNPPIVELLGYFLAGPSERAVLADPSVAQAADADTIWVVQKWDGMAPLTLYPRQQQVSGFGLGTLFGVGGGGGSGGKDDGGSNVGKERKRMLKAITRGCLYALGYVHDRGVIHGSVGSGSILLSTFNDAEYNRLVVKLDNFGFARRSMHNPTSSSSSSSALGTSTKKPSKSSGGGGTQDPLYPSPIPFSYDNDDSPLILGQKGDIRQMAVVVLECILSSLAKDGPANASASSSETIQRVLGDVFEWDVGRYRSYVGDEEQWDMATKLLEEEGGAGWELIQEMVQGTAQASVLLAQSRFIAL